MEINSTELQFLNQGNQLNSGSAAGGYQSEESSSSEFASYMNRETESFHKPSSIKVRDNNINTNSQRSEGYKDLNEQKTSPDNSIDQRNADVQKSGGSQSKEVHQHNDESQERDLSFNDSSAAVDGGQKVNNEASDALSNDEGTITREAPSQDTEESKETVEINMVPAQQVPDTTVIAEGDIPEIEVSIGKAEVNSVSVTSVITAGDTQETEVSIGKTEMKIAADTTVTGLSDTKVEGTSEGEDGNAEFQADLEKMMTEEEQLIEEEVNAEETAQEGIDIEDTLKTSAEENSDLEAGTDNKEEDVHYENHTSDKNNGQRNSHEKSGHKNPAIETAQAVKDNVKPEVADDSEGIHALNKNIKEMIHRHSVTGSSESKAAASMQAAVEMETGMTHPVSSSADIASMSRTADSQMLASVNRPAGMAELLDSIVYAAKSNNRLGVTIEHSELGKLNINLSLDKGNVHVNINAAEKVTKEIIENNIQYIIDSLEKEGVSIGGFSVGMKDYQGRMLQTLMNKNGKIKEFDENVKIAEIRNGLVSVFA